MGTHPIFESDFDCLTDRLNRISEKMSAELACTYAALILNDDDVEITGDKITAILKAANVDFEPFWPSLFAGALKDVDVHLSSPTSDQVLVLDQLPEVPLLVVPLVVMLPQLKKRRRRNLHQNQKMMIWVSVSSIKRIVTRYLFCLFF